MQWPVPEPGLLSVSPFAVLLSSETGHPPSGRKPAASLSERVFDIRMSAVRETRLRGVVVRKTVLLVGAFNGHKIVRGQPALQRHRL